MSVINICICTFKRERSLDVCLRSFIDLRIPRDTEVIVTIIDNDEAGSAGKIVSRLKDSFPLPLHYHIEPKRGIPCARNRAIDETHAMGCDYLIFIDDDEWVEPDWLENLYSFCQQHGGEIIVSGVVISELPENVPVHIRDLFNKSQKPSGSKLSSCATNNVLIPTKITKRSALRFDETNPLAGGTDTIFFCNAVNAGAVILKCAEAVVHESIPENRLTIRWLSKRKYRAGITAAWRKHQNGRSKLNIALSSVFQIAVDSVKCVLMILLWKRKDRNLFWLNACRSAGVLCGILGKRVDSYQQIDGQ